MGGIIHVVHLRFHPDVDDQKIAEVHELGAVDPTSIRTQNGFANEWEKKKKKQLIGEIKALRHKCLLPDTQTPYIKSIIGGAENSVEGLQACTQSLPQLVTNPYAPETNTAVIRVWETLWLTLGLQNGFSHMMITKFESVAHRDYYAKTDPAHLAIVQMITPYLKGLQVLDINNEWDE